MQFSIHISPARGKYPRKFRVPATSAIMSGIWSEPDNNILTPCKIALLKSLPARYRKAWDRAGIFGPSFWFNSNSRWDGERATPDTPYADLYDSRGKPLARIYAIPCKDN